MTLLEMALVMALVVAIMLLWVRLNVLQQQLHNLRDQHDRHVQRGHGPLTLASPPPAAPPAAIAQPPMPAARHLGRPAARPTLRLVKD